MKNLIKPLFTNFFVTILLIGCGIEDNPLQATDPGNGGGDPVINTPIYMRVESITVTRFPELKPNGDKWDYHVFPNSPTRRPDIYVELVKSGNSSYVYQSDLREDAILETAYSSFTFRDPSSPNGNSLPYNVPMNQTYNIDLMDDDGITADDWMGSVNFTPSNYYNNNNATNFHVTLSTSAVTIKIDCRWIY